MRRLRGAFTAGLTALAGAAAAAAVLAQGGRVSDTLDLLTHFAPVYLATGVVVGLTALVARARRAAFLSLIAVAGAAALMAPEYVRDTGPTATPDAPGQIKVIQFNTSDSAAPADRIVDWIVAEKPDVVTLQEARHDLRDRLYRRTGWRISNRYGDVMIFTPGLRLQMDRGDLPPGAMLNFVNATYAAPGGPMEVVTTHVTWPSEGKHLVSRRDLAWVVGRLPRERMILTGDFNATPWSFGQRRLERRLGLIRRDRAVFSYPAPLPILPIDHVYAGPGWATVSLQRGPDLGSDHYPLVVILAPVSPR